MISFKCKDCIKNYNKELMTSDDYRNTMTKVKMLEQKKQRLEFLSSLYLERKVNESFYCIIYLK